MIPSLTILWPNLSAPAIEETRFSYKFCHSMSKQLCEEAGLRVSWVNYSGDPTLGEMLPGIDGDRVLVVTDPETVFSAPAVTAMIRCLENGFIACGPVYNHTISPDQTAALPAPYVDIETYLEVAEILTDKEKVRYSTVASLDPACVLYSLNALEKIPIECHLSEIPPSITNLNIGEATVAEGALVHCGFQNDFERDDLVKLVPQGVKRILDIGCAMGGYGKRLRQTRPEIFLMGVEQNPVMAQSAERYYDDVVRCRVEDADLPCDFDLVNCGDILEHLRDPWTILKRLNVLLRHGGYLVLSVPNAGHWSVVRDLLKGRFRYVPAGLLCVTHLRWFTESSIRNALEEAGFSIEIFQREQIPPTPRGQTFIRDMCATGYGDEKSLMTNEFVIRAVKKQVSGAGPAKIPAFEPV